MRLDGKCCFGDANRKKEHLTGNLFFCYHEYQLKLQIGVDKSPEVNYTRTNRKNFLPKGGDKAWLQ